MKKKILAITLTLAMMTTMLVGCGGGNQAEAPAPQDGEEQPVEQTEPAVELTATQKIIIHQLLACKNFTGERCHFIEQHKFLLGEHQIGRAHV